MWNARLDESQAGIKIFGRNINNLRYTYHSTGIKWIKIKTILMMVKEESENVCLKLNIHKAKIMALGSITSW